MKTVLVYLAPDILMRDAILHKLHENGIETLGPDNSINVIYPNTPNLYFGGASATYDGFRILVFEEEATRARALIKEVIDKFSSPIILLSESKLLSPNNYENYARRFYYFSIASFFIPVVLIPVALYYLVKALKQRQTIKILHALLSFIIMITSAIGVYLSLR